ncbi:MAG: hypothetical protein IJD04_07280 [Desulfovibrionaceae bacterium]|nr:hypothetical protein [Desulfovibrionaceae bacterium]
MGNQIVKYGNVFGFAGAFCALLIGSGFATGQEVMQYFVSYGYWGVAGALTVLILFLYVGREFMEVGYNEKFGNGNDIYIYYGGKYIGGFYDYFSIIFLFMSYFIMVSGAGSTLEQYYGLEKNIGCTAMALVVALTVVLGLSRIVQIIGKIGPAKAGLFIIIGLYGIIFFFDEIPGANAAVPALVESGRLLQASPHWFFAALSYVGFCMLWLGAFLASLGKISNSAKEAKLGATYGAILFCVALLIVMFGLMAVLVVWDVAGTQVPSLLLAEAMSPHMATVFSIIIVLGVYSAAVPLLWTVVQRLAKQGTKKYMGLTFGLAALGAVIAILIPFAKLVNFVYVLNGYVGIFLLILMIVKKFRNRAASR